MKFIGILFLFLNVLFAQDFDDKTNTYSEPKEKPNYDKPRELKKEKKNIERLLDFEVSGTIVYRYDTKK